ncbi:MAG TPA: hypothetical protein VHX43_05365 [Xanthobacteraceae bacterium]|jgi:hypothetical protein|nr:hypothetical protein [Xanthobacteraceae bacterium]
MSIVLGFAPFIAFFALASLISPLVGVAAAFAISFVMTALNWRRGKSLKILDVGSLILFGSTILIILVAAPDWSVGEAGLVVNGGLALISLLSLAIGRPFTAQYAREQIPKQYWNDPLFIRINQLITVVWTLAFAISTTTTAASIYLRTIPHWLEIAAAIGGLAMAIWFTSWYPARVRRSRMGTA